MDKVNVLIVDNNDLDVRMHLKHAINSTSEFDKCTHAVTCREALSKMGEEYAQTDIIFVSYHFSMDQIREFALAMRELIGIQEVALIMLLPSGTARDSLMADSLLAGVDGFLMEPYSCDDLVKITKLASQANKEKSTNREHLAVKFLVKDQLRLLDAVYCLRRSDVDSTQTFQKFRDICLRAKELPPDVFKVYLNTLIDACERTIHPIPLPNPKASYVGKSERAKKKVEQVFISRVESPPIRLDPKKDVLVDGRILKLPPAPKD